MTATVINKASIGFLQALSKNNHRDWFNAHKDRYMAAHDNMVSFADALLVRTQDHQESIRVHQRCTIEGCIFRSPTTA